MLVQLVLGGLVPGLDLQQVGRCLVPSLLLGGLVPGLALRGPVLGAGLEVAALPSGAWPGVAGRSGASGSLVANSHVGSPSSQTQGFKLSGPQYSASFRVKEAKYSGKRRP